MTEETRAESDLDSICVGSASRMQIKLYYNSKKDLESETKERIEIAVRLAKHTKEKIGEDYPELFSKEKTSEKK